MKSFSENIKNARLNNGWSQEQLASKIGFSQSAISQLEKGTRLPTPANLKKFSDVLGVSIEFLVGEDDMLNKRVRLMRSINELTAEGIKKVEEYIQSIKIGMSCKQP